MNRHFADVSKNGSGHKGGVLLFKVSFLHLKDSYISFAQIGIGPQLQVLKKLYYICKTNV